MHYAKARTAHSIMRGCFGHSGISGSALAASVTQSGEQKNMRRVGHTDLQGRPGYQPNVIQYPDGRFIAFAGTHSNIPVPRPALLFCRTR